MNLSTTDTDTEITGHGQAIPRSPRRFRLQVGGPAGASDWESLSDRCSIGSHESNDIVITDRAVSRFHCEIRVEGVRAKLVDLGSRNGTSVDGVDVETGFLRSGSCIRLGRTTLRFQFSSEAFDDPLSTATNFGELVGTSLVMRRLFARLERAAGSGSTILLEGESGTGKEAAARAVHEASDRRGGPFIIVDCGAIPANLLESELFGHEKGSFTGASEQRIGAFEAAHRGTIFLDEIGELPLDLQPKILRVLESRQLRRVGDNHHRSVDLRVIAATNRDLRTDVNDGRFRSDLYYRMAVLRVQMPPLRVRPEDIPPLCENLLARLDPGGKARGHIATPEFFATLARGAWPGNVRELRNHLERCVVFGGPVPLEAGVRSSDRASLIDVTIPYEEARKLGIAEWEVRYLDTLRRAYSGKVKRAAEAVGLNRSNLWRLAKKHGLSWK